MNKEWEKYLLTFLLVNFLLMITIQTALASSRSSRNENTIFDNNQKKNLDFLNTQDNENSKNENLTSEILKSNENINSILPTDNQENILTGNRENLEFLSDNNNREVVSPTLLSPTIRENQKMKIRGYAAPRSVVEVQVGKRSILVETDMDGRFETNFTGLRNGFNYITARVENERKSIPEVSKEFLLYRENKLKKGEKRTINLSEAKSSLHKLEITAKTSCTPILHIDNLENFEAQKSGEKVYKHLVIHSNLEDEQVENVTAYFRVKKSWTKNENIDISKIEVKKFENNSWNSLQTKIENKNENHIYLSSDTDALSVFKVSGETKQVTTELKGKQTEPKAESSKNFPIKYSAIAIILLISLIVIFLSLTKMAKDNDSTHFNKSAQVRRCLM